MTRERVKRAWLSSLMAAVVLGLTTTARDLNAQDEQGFLFAEQFLLLGPFAQPFNCGGNRDGSDMVSALIAPSRLECQYPDDGDDVEYNSALATTTEYHAMAPASGRGFPMWRASTIPSLTCLIELSDDLLGEQTDSVMFLATYVEYKGSEPIDVIACLNADDGAVVWFNADVVIQDPECGDVQDCTMGACGIEQTYTMFPGTYRILIGIFNDGGRWQGSFRLMDAADRTPILHEPRGSWDFTGIDSDGTKPCGPVLDLACNVNEQKGVDLSWTNSDQTQATDQIRILVDETEVGQVAGDATSFTVPTEQLTSDISVVCVANPVGRTCCGVYSGGELAINCGGDRLDAAEGTGLGDGRVWLADPEDKPSPFMQTEVAGVFDFSRGGATPPIAVANTAFTEPVYFDDPAASRLFSSMRTAQTDVIYQIPVARGEYKVNLLFSEGCCSQNCKVFEDPAGSSISRCRVFSIAINDQVVEEQFSPHLEQSRLLNLDLPNSNWGIAVTKTYDVTSEGSITIRLGDLGAGSAPGDPTISGIHIVPAGDGPPPGGSVFHRGDTTDDGNIDLTDAVQLLNFLFQNGNEPSCVETADIDNNGGLDLTDAASLLNYLFQSGGAPAAPGPVGQPCGTDPDVPGSPGDLGCESYSRC